jgi:quercetin dioxygenase-like cupin family protein
MSGSPKDASGGFDPALASWLDEQLGAPDAADEPLIARVRARVMQAVRADAAGVTNVRDTAGAWRPLTPYVQQKILWQTGDVGAFLLRCAPGAVLAPHAHACDEELLVLEGSLCIGDDLVLQAGDFQREPRGSLHAQARTTTGALVYVRGAIDL